MLKVCHCVFFVSACSSSLHNFGCSIGILHFKLGLLVLLSRCIAAVCLFVRSFVCSALVGFLILHTDMSDEKKKALPRVVLGPVLGKITTTSARILVELDSDSDVGSVGPKIRKQRRKRNRNSAENLSERTWCLQSDEPGSWNKIQVFYRGRSACSREEPCIWWHFPNTTCPAEFAQRGGRCMR